jgi:hypothetical protein
MSCDVKMPGKYKIGCSVETSQIKTIQFGKRIGDTLKVSKIIYNYKQKTEQQIKDAIQLEIDNSIRNHPGYQFKDSKSHFNNTGGIDLVLNFELK